MGNPYFDNSDIGQRFQPGTTADGEAVDEKFDRIATGLDATYRDTVRSLKFPFEEGMESQEFTANALQRRNRVLGFDGQGNLELVSGFYYRQAWQPSTTYFLNDVVLDPETTNLYVCIRRHVSGATPNFSDQNTWYLAIDADTVRRARNEAVAARDDARASAQSARGDEAATRAYRNEVAADKAQVQQLRQGASQSANSAAQSAGVAQAAQQGASQSLASVQQVATNVNSTAQQVAQNANAANASAQRAEQVSQRINDTTTMDFLNFELVGPDLIAHFAGYADAANFSINTAGELEVTL